MPATQNEGLLELEVVRPAFPERKMRLYARNDGKAREVHFVATQLKPTRGERFLAKSIRTIGLPQFVEEYNHSKPIGLENTLLVLDADGLTMDVDGQRINLGHGQLEAYGTNLLLRTQCPKSFPIPGPDGGKLTVTKGLQGFELLLTGGLRIDSMKARNGEIVVSTKTAHPGPKALEGLRGRHGGRIRLESVEDKAWLGALSVGEGSFFGRESRSNHILTPCLEIAMQDEEAIDKASILMGIRKTKGEWSESSGRWSWRVVAIGARMMDIFEAIRPFLTTSKIRQAEEAIRRGRDSGFLTKSEMKEERKRALVQRLKDKPGSSTRDLGRGLGIGYSYAKKYLEELKKEGKVYSEIDGAPHRLRLDWFAI
ncbi:MAG TPA: hypothetical protein VKF39_02770 [Nitrososphaerales archaeon]|nr:hypothetical protein [Nitrososphaerales archaeon]